MSKITEFFSHFPFLKADDIAEIEAISVMKSYQTGEQFIKLGATRKKVGIIETGLIRGYSIKSSGEEVSVIFAKEGEIASTHELIFYEEPSRQIVEFLEPTTMLVFDYRDIERLATVNPRIDQMRNQFIQDFLVKVLQRLETFLICSPEERYLWLIREEPSLMQRVQQKHLASFLGITPVSLSRLRSRMSKKH
ncbi:MULTISPECIES: Crp/Fnr family transcriptional regulator [unclassified Aureispira]|uniref:Crp/Fnr family transcriptional regulator n=1 Tax=unclassified Aureispira TaxID=2649989 RepID=UPI000697028C|nr:MULTISPECIES: Crp/Fnr family transcriptional regulator [unclassified Aureispira]WMX12067.1 Crp/Fnr family transcriptional regulator [Aureispira sp. CCB-E]